MSLWGALVLAAGCQSTTPSAGIQSRIRLPVPAGTRGLTPRGGGDEPVAAPGNGEMAVG